MFTPATLKAFQQHVKSMRRESAKERRPQQAAELEAKLDAIERQAITVWRCVNGRPVEIIHQR